MSNPFFIHETAIVDDNVYIDETSNGLVHAAERFKKSTLTFLTKSRKYRYMKMYM